MKANGWANPHPTLDIFRITFQALILNMKPSLIRLLITAGTHFFRCNLNSDCPIYPAKLLLGVLIANSVEWCLEIISRAVVKSLELSMALSVLWFYYLSSFFIIYLSLCKYRYNILYMQINIPGLHKAQGHNPKGH